MENILKVLTSKGLVDLALWLGIISAFIWSLCLAVVFVIKATRSKKLFGAEFDPENPATNRRRR